MCDHSSHGDAHHHDHSENSGEKLSLFSKICIDQIECLNEAVEDSGRLVFKSWSDRLDSSKFVDSDTDEELLFRIPFAGSVKLKTISVIGGEGETHPSSLKLFKNAPNMTFDDVGRSADQEVKLQPDLDGRIQYPLKVARFNNVEQLCIHVPNNFGSDTTRIYYIGLSGDFLQPFRERVTITNYEARANPADHKTSLLDNVSHEIS